jgi:putative endonuclease
MSNKKSKVKVKKPLTQKKKIGNLGEDIACTYLKKHGFEIKDRNYLKKYGEIDIVAKKEGKYHFIEVKSVTRATETVLEVAGEGVIHETTAQDSYRPEDNMHGLKLKRLANTIQTYIAEKQVGDNWQFDVMTVVLNMETRLARVEHMENIVL